MNVPPEAFEGLMLSRSKLKPYASKLDADAAECELIELAKHFLEPDGLVRIGYIARVHIAKRSKNRELIQRCFTWRHRKPPHR